MFTKQGSNELVYAKRALCTISGKNELTADFQFLGTFSTFYATMGFIQTFLEYSKWTFRKKSLKNHKFTKS